MQYRHVYKNVIIANYGGSKQVDNDDGSLFWRTYENFMAYGECLLSFSPFASSGSAYTRAVADPHGILLSPQTDRATLACLCLSESADGSPDRVVPEVQVRWD
jgi:hypothetical protein